MNEKHCLMLPIRDTLKTLKTSIAIIRVFSEGAVLNLDTEEAFKCNSNVECQSVAFGLNMTASSFHTSIIIHLGTQRHILNVVF